MPLNVAFWVLMLVWVLFGLWTAWPNWPLVGGNLLLFLLFLVVGWKVFGAPLHGG